MKPEKRKKSSLPSRGVSLFTLFGFEVKVDLTWLMLALLVTWTLAAGLFPTSYPGLATETYWWMGLFGALGVFFSIVFHEFSHSLVARHYGLPIKGITLFIFGGVAEMEDEPKTPGIEFLMAVAGPIASLVLAALFYLLGGIDWPVAVDGVIYYLGLLNLVLAIFNLVPAFPLDGGRMLRATLWGWKKDILWATRIASNMGSAFGLVLMALGVLGFLQGAFIGGMWWLLIGAFLRGAASNSFRQTQIRLALQDEPVRRFMTTEPVTVSPGLPVEDLIEDYIYKYHFKAFPVVKDSRLLGCVTLSDIKRIPRPEWPSKRVADLLTERSEENTVSPDENTLHVLAAMMQPGAMNWRMVVQGDRLLGVLSLRDLRDLITLRLELEPPQQEQ